MFGFDSQGKELKNAMQIAGADMTLVKEWLKMAEKTKKQYEIVKDSYEKARASLLRITEIMEALEKFLVSNRETSEFAGDFSGFMKELKKLRGNADHEFLISAQDREFHLTYDTILKIGPEFLEGKANGIILQSEIENLISLSKEAIEKERPDLVMLAYFYLKRTDKEICELPHKERIGKVQRVFWTEFLSDMTRELENSIAYAEANRNDSRMAVKLAILLDAYKGTEIEERARNILTGFYAV